jgi:hypothetical protein
LVKIRALSLESSEETSLPLVTLLLLENKLY